MDDTHLVLVLDKYGRWDDQTPSVADCIADSAHGLFRIRYKNNPTRAYSYAKERVRFLKAITTLDPAVVQLRIRDRLVSDAETVIKFPGFYLVRSGSRRALYDAADVYEERDVSKNEGCNVALSYFRSIVEKLGLRNDEGNSILAGQFKYLARVPDSTILAAYLNPEGALAVSEPARPLIYPFGMNASQKTAVEHAFRSQVTLVQGPPGTGKTQAILNMVANAIHLGQTVAVVSNNNAATANVAAKLQAQGLGFLLANLGRRENKEAFIASQGEYPETLNRIVMPPQEKARRDESIASLLRYMDELIQANNDRAMLSQQILRTREEAALHRRATDSSPSPEALAAATGWTSQQLLDLLVECEESGPNVSLGWLSWIKAILRHGFHGMRRRRRLFALGPHALRILYYDRHLTELEGRLAAIERLLASRNWEALRHTLEAQSWALLWTSIAERFTHSQRRTVFTSHDLWMKYSAVLHEYPVVLSTTHSLKTSLSPDCLYDLLIVDEASQVDVTTGVLALSCAKRVVIVGDEQQLPNVLTDDDRRRAEATWHAHRPACDAWNHAEHSLLSSAAAVWPHAPTVLLREHYRCHPKIAGFFNRKFYADQLIPMTVDGGESDVMQVVFTVPGNHARGRVNQRQIDVIRQEVLPALRNAGVTDIGIISPYRDQVALLRETLGEDVEVDTVHGFQGREKQAIVVSTVDNMIGDFVDDPRLLNVAVSRAQSRFVVVMAEGKDSYTTNFGELVRYIRHQQQLVTNSQVRSVFDLLYGNYQEARRRFLDANGRGSDWDSENLAEAVIRGVLASNPFATISLGILRHVPLSWLVPDTAGLTDRQRRFASNPFAHVDFTIYDTTGKRPLVCIEVDGWAFHRPGSLQSERDEVKNGIFLHCGIPLVRISTTGSDEKAVIAGALKQAVGIA